MNAENNLFHINAGRMQKLKENMTNLFGERGEKWLSTLPTIISELASYWQLSAIIPVDNMTYHYVAKAIFKNQPVVLKVGCDKAIVADEKQALNYFNGHASIKLIDSNDQYHALLLQQAVPGTTLKSLYSNNVELVMDCYVKTMQRLHDKPMPVSHHFRHANDWLKAINKGSSEKIPKDLLKKAIDLKTKLLLSSPSKQFVLHGDLHHDNILQHGDDWLIIDPKGIIGEEEFEIAAFDFIADSELNNQDIKNLFHKRCNLIANKSHLDSERIRDWVFVRLILSAVWSIEDNGDPSWAINLARVT